MINSPEMLHALEISSLFHGVPQELLAENLNQSNIRELHPGETLLEHGQNNEHVYIILSGHLKIQTSKAQVEPIAMLGEGECVGEMSILGDGYTSAYVIAATEVQLLVIHHDALWHLINGSHVAARNMLSILTQRIRMTDQILATSFEQREGFSGISIIDELTGLYNRQWTQKKFDRLLQRSLFSNNPGSLLIMEMDNYKDYCYEHGQLGGDQALRGIAYNILLNLRPDDHAGCYFGQQFSLFLPNTVQANGCIAADRLRRVVEDSVVVLPSGDSLPPVTVSFGVTQVNLTGDSLASLFARADGALQRAREKGGNRVEGSK